MLDRHPEVEFVQIQLNYAYWNNQVVNSGKLYEILHSRGLPIIVMEPVKGGMPASISIPDIFRAVNTARLYAGDNRPRMFYTNLTRASSGKAGDCIECRQCESVCPQHLPIVELLKEAAERFEQS